MSDTEIRGTDLMAFKATLVSLILAKRVCEILPGLLNSAEDVALQDSFELSQLSHLMRLFSPKRGVQSIC